MKQTYKKPVIIIDLYMFIGMLCASPTISPTTIPVVEKPEDELIGD